MILHSKKTKVITIKRNLFPGNNFIPDSEVEKITGHQLFKDLVEKGDFEILTDPRKIKKGVPSAKNFAEEVMQLSPKQAKDVVKQHYNKKDLEDVVDKDRRASVVSVAEKQLSVIMPDGSDAEKG